MLFGFLGTTINNIMAHTHTHTLAAVEVFSTVTCLKCLAANVTFRADTTSWCKYQAQRSKRQLMLHVLEVQHLKEQHAKGLERLV